MRLNSFGFGFSVRMEDGGWRVEDEEGGGWRVRVEDEGIVKAEDGA